MTAKSITSAHNQRVKDAVKLRDRRQRSRQGRIVIDGSREILQAFESGLRFVEAFVCEPLCTTGESRQLVERLEQSDVTLWQVTPEVFEKLAFGQRHEGVVVVSETPHTTLADIDVPAESLVTVLVGLEKPGNVGAALRTADAAGIQAVIVADAGTDLYNPNCIRASLGTVFTQQVCQCTSRESLAWLRERGSKIFAARLDASTVYTDVDFTGEVALVLGSEAAGLDATWQSADITPVRVPMRGTADSLNVSATAAVLFYEALRQRKCD